MMAPLHIPLNPGRCPGHKRLNNTRAPICITCGCLTGQRHNIEPAAAFIDGCFQCVNWRGTLTKANP